MKGAMAANQHRAYDEQPRYGYRHVIPSLRSSQGAGERPPPFADSYSTVTCDGETQAPVSFNAGAPTRPLPSPQLFAHPYQAAVPSPTIPSRGPPILQAASSSASLSQLSQQSHNAFEPVFEEDEEGEEDPMLIVQPQRPSCERPSMSERHRPLHKAAFPGFERLEPHRYLSPPPPLSPLYSPQVPPYFEQPQTQRSRFSHSPDGRTSKKEGKKKQPPPIGDAEGASAGLGGGSLFRRKRQSGGSASSSSTVQRYRVDWNEQELVAMMAGSRAPTPKCHSPTVAIRQMLGVGAREEDPSRHELPPHHLVQEEQRDVKRHTAMIRASWIEVDPRRQSRLDFPLQTARNGMPLFDEGEWESDEHGGVNDGCTKDRHGKGFFSSLKKTAWKLKPRKAKTSMVQRSIPTPFPFEVAEYRADGAFPPSSSQPLNQSTPPRRLRRASVDVYSPPPKSNAAHAAFEDSEEEATEENRNSSFSPLKRRNRSLDMLRAADSVEASSDIEEYKGPLRIVVEEPTPDCSANDLAEMSLHSRLARTRGRPQASLRMLEDWKQTMHEQQHTKHRQTEQKEIRGEEDDIVNGLKGLIDRDVQRGVVEVDVAARRLGLKPLQLPTKYRNEMKTFDDDKNPERACCYQEEKRSLHSPPHTPRCLSDEIKRTPVPSPSSGRQKKKANSLGTDPIAPLAPHQRNATLRTTTATRRKRREVKDEGSDESSSMGDSSSSDSSSSRDTDVRRSAPSRERLELPGKERASGAAVSYKADMAGHTQTSVGTSILYADQALMGQYQPSDLAHSLTALDAPGTSAAPQVAKMKGKKREASVRSSPSSPPSPSSSSTASIISYVSSDSMYSRTTNQDRLSRQDSQRQHQQQQQGGGVTALIQSYIHDISADETNATFNEAGNVVTPESAHEGFTFRPPHYYTCAVTPGRVHSQTKSDGPSESSSARERRFSHLWTQLGFEGSPCPPSRKHLPRLVLEDHGDQNDNCERDPDSSHAGEEEREGEKERRAAVRVSDLDLTKLHFPSPPTRQPQDSSIATPSTTSGEDLNRPSGSRLRTHLTVGLATIPVPRLGESHLFRRRVASSLVLQMQCKKQSSRKKRITRMIGPTPSPSFQPRPVCRPSMIADDWDDEMDSSRSSSSSAESSPFFCSAARIGSEEEFSPLTDCSFWPTYGSTGKTTFALPSPWTLSRKPLVLCYGQEDSDGFEEEEPQPFTITPRDAIRERDIMQHLRESTETYPSTPFSDWTVTVLCPPKTVEEVEFFLVQSRASFLTLCESQPNITDRWFVDWEGRWSGATTQKKGKRWGAAKRARVASELNNKPTDQKEKETDHAELDETSIYFPEMQTP